MAPPRSTARGHHSGAVALRRWGQLRALGRAVRVLGGRPTPTPGAVVLAYHDISEAPGPDRYCVSPARMRSQLRMAVRAGLRFVKLSELADAFERGADLDGVAAIAFDDSLVGVHRHAMPILLELGLPATVFAVTGALGQVPPWWPGSARVMTMKELAEMSGMGFEVACHTHSHPRLPEMEDTALARELQAPRTTLEDLTGSAVDLFAYPFGAHDERVRSAVAGSGYRAAFTFLNGRVTPELDRHRLPRLNMTGDRSMARFAYHLARAPTSWPDTQLDRAGERRT